MTRSKQLGKLTSAAATWETLYTVPDSHVTILKSVSAYFGHSPDTGAFWLSIQPAGTSDFYIWYRDNACASGSARVIETWLVLEPGDVLRTFSTYSDTRSIAHGAELVSS